MNAIRPEEGRPDRWPVAWFFIPMPEPLGFPHGYRVEGLRIPSIEDLAAQDPVADLDVSIQVHQQHTDETQTVQDTKHLFGLAADTIRDARQLAGDGGVDGPSPAAQPPPWPGRRTVLEVAVPLRLDDREDALTEAFNRGLETVRLVQRAYATFTQRPLKLTTLRNLPIAVPVSEGHLWLEGEDLHSQMGPLGMFRVNIFAAAADASHPVFGETELERFGQTLDQLSRRTPFNTYAEIRREGWVQRDYEGNTRLAGLLAGIAGEVLLDTLLLHLMWEERDSPESAAGVFDNQFHRTRVVTHYHDRLGGDWRSGGRSPVSRYLTDLAPLRNRVAHGGHEPSREDVEDAYELLGELEHYVGDLLASDRGRRDYPRTAMTWLGQRGLARRGAWTRRIRELTSDSAEPDWIDTFARWRFFADRAREEAPPLPGSDPAALDLMAELHPDGALTWLIHDRDQHMAARLDGAAVLEPAQLEGLEALRSAVSEGLDQIERVVIDFDSGSMPGDLDWVPEYVYIPELAIHLPPR